METPETQRDYLGLMRLKVSAAVSGDSKRLLETHEIQRDYWGLLSLSETNGQS